MPGPDVIFAFIVATLLGSVFHLIFGGDARRLVIFLFAGWIGFSIGQMLGETMDFDPLKIGQLHVVTALAGGLVTLFLALIFTSERSQRRSSR